MAGSDDTVSCFLCFKSLDGWEPADCAWHEHQSHSSPCPLVTLNLLESRLRTFDKWPGAKVKGGVRGLSEAGFFYLPKDDGDDTCTCYQCGLSLDGWETDDDPRHEHSRRRPDCPFIVNGEYIKPASFEFILGNQPDNLAISDINNRPNNSNTPYSTNHSHQTPLRKHTSTGVGQTTGKKIIKISVPQSAMKPGLQSTTSTPQSLSKQTRVISSTSTSKKRSNFKVDLKSDLLSLFPSLKSQQDKILSWTMEELFDHLIKEKVEMFQEFLSKQQSE